MAIVDCKTVRIFAYSSTREQSNKRSGTRLKTESETGERGSVRLARFARVRLLRHALLILRRKKNDGFAVYGHCRKVETRMKVWTVHQKNMSIVVVRRPLVEVRLYLTL